MGYRVNLAKLSSLSSDPLETKMTAGKALLSRQSATSGTRFDPRTINQRAFQYYARLNRIQQYVKSHPDEKVSLRQAAGISRMSEAYFSSFFHQKVGVCFKDWRAHNQIQQAIRLMRTQNRTITNIGLEAGFGDLRTFERTFKLHTGLTPQQYKKTVQP